jgi:hypothetical protein
MVKKNCELWRKMGLFGPDSDPANQLQMRDKKSGGATGQGSAAAIVCGVPAQRRRR